MEVRINKYLSSAGYCSRREADRLLEQGRVTIDGIPAQMGSKVTDESCVRQRQIRVIIILLIILGILKESIRLAGWIKIQKG